MAKIRAIEKSGSEEYSFEEYTQNITLNSTDYVYLTTGFFLNCVITRTSVSSAPVVTLYAKVGGEYIPVSANTATVNGTVTIMPTDFKYGEIYIKKQSGSNFTSTAFKLRYGVID